MTITVSALVTLVNVAEFSHGSVRRCSWPVVFSVCFSAEHDIFGEVSSSDDEVNILDSGDDAAGPAGFRPDDVKDSLDLGFAEAAATLDPDVCESL